MGEVFVVRGYTADGSIVDLLHFSDRALADRYAEQLRHPLPLCFDSVDVVSKRLIGPISLN